MYLWTVSPQFFGSSFTWISCSFWIVLLHNYSTFWGIILYYCSSWFMLLHFSLFIYQQLLRRLLQISQSYSTEYLTWPLDGIISKTEIQANMGEKSLKCFKLIHHIISSIFMKDGRMILKPTEKVLDIQKLNACLTRGGLEAWRPGGGPRISINWPVSASRLEAKL